MRRTVIGILAHVDAGKTTLSERILYLAGKIRKMGRVDTGDTHFDTNEMERARGITIFSKQAVFCLGDLSITWMDTPGHVDFSPEMERTLQVLDYAVLVISGADGVQGHTQTLWRLLKSYQIPCFLFVNKMDQNGTDRQKLMEELCYRLDENCMDFGFWGDELLESLAMCEESLLEAYLEQGTIEESNIQTLIGERKVFPCYFGSALKGEGVEEFLADLERWVQCPKPKKIFGAKVFKISRDSQGNRLTHMRITGGSLKVRELLPGKEEEKINQIRVYSGEKFETIKEAKAGMVCAVAGPMKTYPGQGIGGENESEMPILEPVLTYRILLPEGFDKLKMLGCLRQLEEEEPQLHIVWNESLQEIHAQIMGEVQLEVLKNLIGERFGTEVEFGAGRIVYKETIERSVEGVGHFEPLRHYAEVHLWMEPGEKGSGLQFDTCCSEDVLDKNWQRLILTHLEEKTHRGVLTGAEITDMKITLIAGKAHLKHTEGGDFRQATYRAVRQGLREAGCKLLEPYYNFRLEVPTECVGRAMADLERRFGKFEPPFPDGDNMVLTGSAPVAAIQDYSREVVRYTGGRGRFFCALKGYESCHNEEEVVNEAGYDPEGDLDNPTGSVFCAHGAGFVVPWDQVKDYMHVDGSCVIQQLAASERESKEDFGQREKTKKTEEKRGGFGSVRGENQRNNGVFGAEDKELEEIFARTYGTPKRRQVYDGPRQVKYQEKSTEEPSEGKQNQEKKGGMERGENYKQTGMSVRFKEEYLVVDGYNIIFAWEELRELAKETIDGARYQLMDLLCNYQAFRSCVLIVVFDAYKVVGNPGHTEDYHNIHVVYTKEAETADQYIERFAYKMGKEARVTVATSDGLEQRIILGAGCIRMSAKDLKEEVEYTAKQIQQEREKLPSGKKNLPFELLQNYLAKP